MYNYLIVVLYYFILGNKVQRYLKGKFGDRFIDKKSWPPRSPDLNPCDSFLRRYLKSRV